MHIQCFSRQIAVILLSKFTPVLYGGYENPTFFGFLQICPYFSHFNSSIMQHFHEKHLKYNFLNFANGTKTILKYTHQKHHKNHKMRIDDHPFKNSL